MTAQAAYALRHATADDVEAVLAFWLVSAEGTDRHDSAQALRALIARDPEVLLLAVEGEALIGSLIAGWDGWRAHLYRLAVRGDRRRQRVGRALLAAAEERFAALGSRRSDAMVLRDNDLGQRTWAAAGYAQQPEWSRWVKPLTPSEDRA